MKKIEIEIPDGYEFDKETMSIKPIIDNNVYIDLGLPSGTLWAKYNIGATREDEIGDYYSFDEAQKFNPPTKEQIDELLKYCFVRREEKGYTFLSEKNMIFMPYGGTKVDNKIMNKKYGFYWSSSPSNATNAYILYFGSGYLSSYDISYSSDFNCAQRTIGKPVRPVKSK